MQILQGFGASLIDGLWITVELSLCSLAIGLVLGCLGAIMKLSSSVILRRISETYTTVIRAIPELLVLLILYFGGTAILSKIMGSYVEVSAFVAGVVALSTIFGAYATETIRAAFLTIDRGQVEAGKAFGFSPRKLFFRIELPQLWRYSLPGLGNLWLVLLKDSALVSIIGLEDLMRKTKIAAGFTKEPFTFYFAAALLYLVLTIISVLVLNEMRKRTELGVRSVQV